MAGENDTESDLDTQLEAEIERFFAAGPSEPDAGGGPPADADEDTPPEGSDDDDEDTGAEAGEDDDEGDAEEGDDLDEDEEDEGSDEDEESDEDDDEEEDEEEEEILTVTAEERQAIEKDPTLKKLHRLMQGDYTRKAQALSTRERAVERIENTLRDPDKSADYLAGIYSRQPTVAAAAFEKVATGELAEDFLIAVGMQSPEVLEKAYDRVREIVDDPKEKARWEKDQAQLLREEQVARREQTVRRTTFNRAFDRIHAIATREAEKLGFDPEETTELEGQIKELVRGRVQKDGTIGLSPKEVRKAVQREKTRLDRIYDRAQKRTRSKLAKESQDRTRKKATRAKERGPAPPSPAARKPVKDRKRFKPPEEGDGLDAYVDHFFAGH